jgi:hypothetical protein
MNTEPKHKNIFVALAAAQSEMGPAIKNAMNPHFKKTYADLSGIVEAARPSLNGHGIAFLHLPETIDGNHYMKTELHHGESETSVSCVVPLIISKNDMQGYKSATTYAKRIGLESLTGIAPEDDDGNAAAKAPPKAPATVSIAQFTTLKNAIGETDTDEAGFLKYFTAPSLEQFPLAKYDAAIGMLEKKKQTKKPNADLGNDEIQY